MGQGWSQTQCTAPINIVRNLQTEKICKLKCSYQFNYTPTTLSIWNEGMFLCLGVDEVATPPVIYNDDNYNLLTTFLVSPSIHTYNDKAADAELIMWHMNTSNTKQLFVCVPIKASSTTTADSAMFLDLIMQEVAATAPTDGQHTIYHNVTFSFNKFVPMRPYFSYAGDNILLTTLLGGKCYRQDNGQVVAPDVDYLVYHTDDAITISPQALESLKKVLPKPLNVPAVDQSLNPGGVFYNPNGPISQSSGEIYIYCQPTGADGEILVAARLDSGGVLNNELMKKVANFTFVKIIIGALVMILIWKLSTKMITGIAANSARMAGGASAAGGTSAAANAVASAAGGGVAKTGRR